MTEEFNNLHPSIIVRHSIGYDEAFYLLAMRTGRSITARAPQSEHAVFDCRTGVLTVYRPT